MKYVLFLLLLEGALCSCKSKMNIRPVVVSTKAVMSSKSATIPIEIKALDLTEDMSRVSSGNDEVLFLIYDLKTGIPLGETLCSDQKVLSSSDNIFYTGLRKEGIAKDASVLFLILEQDSETPMEQVDAIFRIHHEKIIQAYDNNDYLEMEKYLGDEDLIGYKVIKEIHRPETISFDFRGVYKLDSYHYRIRIGN